MRGHKAELVFHSKMGKPRNARKFCCDGNPLAINYGVTDRQTTGTSLINGFFHNPVRKIDAKCSAPRAHAAEFRNWRSSNG